jgi:N-acetyl-anhydromuramyl-L-alanine amidase AmpD
VATTTRRRRAAAPEYVCPTGDPTAAELDVLDEHVGLEGRPVATFRKADAELVAGIVAEITGAVHGEPPITRQAYHVSSGANEPPLHRVVIHTAECDCSPGAATGIGNYFAQGSSGGSAHYGVDPAAEGHYVHEAAIAWHAPPNQWSVGVEIAGRASFTAAQWQQVNVQAALHRAAARTADLVHRYGLPVVWLSSADLLAGKRGITGHVCVSRAWHQSSHVDPGVNFPVRQFLQLVQAYLAAIPAPRPPAPAPRPVNRLVWALQRAAHVAASGHWDRVTDVALARLRDTHPASGRAAIKLLQRQLGLVADGVWGPHTQAAVHAAIVAVQKALGQVADGVWGRHTQIAFAGARARLYMRSIKAKAAR